ncbi:PH domain-containing protein [Micromonospora sp. NPDC050397]|uniref:PH domain-containing protein n=1 Tax=Micromonospora sp. NPDC050397 TaxID=3364279 RepID=UPI00384F629E
MSAPVDTSAGRSDRRDRFQALLLVVAAAGLATLWLVAGGWRPPESWPFQAHLALSVLLPWLLVFGLMGLGVWLPSRAKPAALRVRTDPADPAFVAPPHHLTLATLASAQLTFAAANAGSQLMIFSDGDTPPLFRALILVTFAGSAALAGLAIRQVVAIMRDGIRLELRPDGLLVVGLLGRQRVPWEAIAVGPSSTASRWSASPIGIGRPDLVRSGRWIRLFPQVLLPLNQLWVRPDFVTNAINHYLFHPEFRAAIGTEAEYGRLRQELATYSS